MAKAKVKSKSKSVSDSDSDSDSIIDKAKVKVKSKVKVKDSDSDSNSDSIVKSKSDIRIGVLEYKKIDDSYNNYLKLSFEGKRLNNVILNTLRRVISELIPIYAFDRADIEISKNSSIYNNDYMRLRLSQFPVIGIINEYDTIHKSSKLEYDANVSTFDKQIEDINVLADIEQMTKLEKSQNLIININVTNTTNDIYNVSTDDKGVNYYYKGVNVASPYKNKLLILKLKPGEEFVCSMYSSLNIGLKSANFMVNSACTFSEPDDKDHFYKFNLETLKQITEKEAIIRACAIINIKLDNFLTTITSKINEYKSEQNFDSYNIDTEIDSAIQNSSDDVLEQHRIKGLITIENESHTFGNLLSRFLQDHSAIIFAGYKIDHLLIKELTIGYKTDGTDIINIFKDIIKDAKKVYNDISEQVKKLNID